MRQIIIMYLLLLPGVALFIYNKHRNNRQAAVIIKAFCTGIIVMTGWKAMLGVADEFRIYAMLIVAGLGLGLIADIVINYYLPLGMLFFGLGHLCYTVAILCLSTQVKLSIPIFIVLYALVIFLFRKSRIAPGKLLIPGILYSLIITFMVSLAATIPLSFPGCGFVLFSGAVLFFLSDAISSWNSLKRFSKRLDALSLYCYYIGQSLFAVSIFSLW
ncbi:MAG: lysoplasmalogenase [Clostridiales bacterium]|nr:lysoplasmalogenase [Clostridiales bacterium]